MSKINNGRLDQYGAKPFEQQYFGTADVEGVKQYTYRMTMTPLLLLSMVSVADAIL